MGNGLLTSFPFITMVSEDMVLSQEQKFLLLSQNKLVLVSVALPDAFLAIINQVVIFMC